MKAALRRPPTHHQAGTMARAKALLLEEEKAELVRASLQFARACHGARALLAAEVRPSDEDIVAIVVSGHEYANTVHAYLTRRRS